MKRRLSAAFSVLLGVLAVLGELGIFLFLRFINRQYDGPWVVAEYAEPFRSSFLALVVVATAWLTARAARAGSTCAALGMLAVPFLGVALSGELAMGIFFHPISGQFGVAIGTLSRVEFRLPINETGPCFASDTRGFFRWSLDGRTFSPRLLPLPLASKELEAELRCPWLVN